MVGAGSRRMHAVTILPKPPTIESNVRRSPLREAEGRAATRSNQRAIDTLVST